MEPLILTAYTVTNALGRGTAATLTALRDMSSGLRPCDLDGTDVPTWIGRVEGLEHEPVAGTLARYDCRNNRLAAIGLAQDQFALAVEQACARYGAGRVGVFLGTSTSGVAQTEQYYRQLDAQGERAPDDFHFLYTHDNYSLASFTRECLQLEGPAVVVSTACSSSAKVFAVAARYLQLGLCDAAIVGGTDSLCLTTLYGFHSLELVSSEPCRPWGQGRNGLSLGEAAGFALLERRRQDSVGVALLGYGESSDAHHMSTPHPDGIGAADAMAQALARAGVAADAVDYINLHGTATPSNDRAEDRAVTTLFGSRTPCSSTKGWTGHTLGAAGITEAVIACLCLEHGFAPGTLNTTVRDAELSAALLLENRDLPLRTVLSNSFGFGGTNCSLLFGRLS